MKIICIDNFARDEISDVLICENINGAYGRIIVDFLNEKHSGWHSPSYFKLVEDDYELYKYEI